MGLTEQQKIPEKSPEPREKWTIRSLLGMKGILGAVTKDFKPVELAFIFMLVITGFGEVAGRSFTWMWYSIFALTLIATFFLRIPREELKKKEEK